MPESSRAVRGDDGRAAAVMGIGGVESPMCRHVRGPAAWRGEKEIPVQRRFRHAIRAAAALTLASCFAIFHVTSAAAQSPPGDECDNAILIGAGTHVGTTVGMSPGPEFACAVDDTVDFWYRYPAAYSCNLARVCGALRWYVSIYDACDGEFVACSVGESCFSGGAPWLGTPGHEYMIRVAADDGRAGAFRLFLGTSPTTRDSAYNPRNNSLYFLLSPADWECAEEYAHTLEGHLATIDDAAENQWVRSNLLQGPSAAIGLNDFAVEGEFRWASGAAVGFTNWAPGQPDDAGNEDAVVIDNATGLWSDVAGTLVSANSVVEVESGEMHGNPIPIDPGTTAGTTRGRFAGVGEPRCATDDTIDAWYLYISPYFDCPLTVVVCGEEGFSATVAVYGSGQSNPVACTTDGCAGVTWTGHAGQRYSIRVAGRNGTTGDFQLTLIVPTIPLLAGPIRRPETLNRYYLLGSESWTQSEAYARCLGGTLATIDDAAENEWVRETFGGLAGGQPLWIGLNDASEEGNFEWSSGSAALFRNWAPGQPDDGGLGEDYVAMSAGTGLWEDLADSPSMAVLGVAEVNAVGLRGDSNCDGTVDGGDIDCFVLAMIDPTGADWFACARTLNPECMSDYLITNDINRDGAVDNGDIDAFVHCLISGPAPGQPCP